MAKWLSIQQDRLNSASSDGQQHDRTFENFMRVMGSDSMPTDVRLSAANSLVQHAAAGRLAEVHQQMLSEHSSFAMMDEIPNSDPNYLPLACALSVAINLHSEQANLSMAIDLRSEQPRRIFRSLDDDLALQRKPLSQQMNRWLRTTAMPELDASVSFDDEPNAKSFARLLARRQPYATDDDPEAVLRAGSEVVLAIVRDPELRALVFAMAENALGTCRDNVTEGFSAIVTAVRNHQMAEAVRHGTVGAAELSTWARGQFRLHALEQEVHRFISKASEKNQAALAVNSHWMQGLFADLRARNILPTNSLVDSLANPRSLRRELDEALEASSLLDRNWTVLLQGIRIAAVRRDLQSARHLLVGESVEAMLHAKVKLRETLALPQDTSSELAHVDSSALTANDLKSIEAAVRLLEADGTSLRDFLLSNDTWCVGMKELHRSEFEALNRKFDEDPFFDLDLPPHASDDNVAEQMAYAAAAKDFEQRKVQAETALLLKCAGLE